MNLQAQKREQGQAIVIIALVMVVLIGFMALAVDGGNGYFKRRVSQNASDAGSLAGAAVILEAGMGEGDIWAAIDAKALENGIDPAGEGNTIHAWFIADDGSRISENEIGSFGYIPLDQGARGVEVTVETTFDAFFAPIVGVQEMTAAGNSGAVVIFPNFCADWMLYGNCDLGSGHCYNNTVNLSGSTTVMMGGGIHSNSGLHVTGSDFQHNPSLAEWGTPGACTGVICPDAQQVPPEPMPEIYDWADFQPGGGWWNDMCSGSWGARCHSVGYSLGNQDVISSGLWVVDGSITRASFFNPAQTKYTLVATGNIQFNNDMPMWEPFTGSSATGGSKALFISFAEDTDGVQINGRDLSWTGVIYAPYGLARMSSSGNHSGEGTIFAWRIDLSGATMNVSHSAYWCPPEQAKITLLW